MVDVVSCLSSFIILACDILYGPLLLGPFMLVVDLDGRPSVMVIKRPSELSGRGRLMIVIVLDDWTAVRVIKCQSLMREDRLLSCVVVDGRPKVKVIKRKSERYGRGWVNERCPTRRYTSGDPRRKTTGKILITNSTLKNK